MAAPEQLSNCMGRQCGRDLCPGLLRVRRNGGTGCTPATSARRRAQLRWRRAQLQRRHTQPRRWQRQHLLLIPLRRRQLSAHLQVANRTRVLCLGRASVCLP